MICVRSLGLAKKRKKSNSENPEPEQVSQCESSQLDTTIVIAELIAIVALLPFLLRQTGN
jgi:hypothetical protein